VLQRQVRRKASADGVNAGDEMNVHEILTEQPDGTSFANNRHAPIGAVRGITEMSLGSV
jgi:hypothetical protein